MTSIANLRSLLARELNLPEAGPLHQVSRILYQLHAMPNRAYHNLDHPWEMAEWLEKIRPLVTPEEFQAIVWFIFTHDCVYNFGSPTNEVESAGLAFDFGGLLGLSDRVQSYATSMILDSKTHAIVGQSYLAIRLALQCDMAILGSAPERYHIYSRSQIPHEFCGYGLTTFTEWSLADKLGKPYTVQQFMQGRADWLRRQEVENTFVDEPFKALLSQAKANVADELAWLASLPVK
ncbi:MAG: hypothetical protein WAX89_07270 [Alphaproteobacteria bacterium]